MVLCVLLLIVTYLWIYACELWLNLKWKRFFILGWNKVLPTAIYYYIGDLMMLTCRLRKMCLWSSMPVKKSKQRFWKSVMLLVLIATLLLRNWENKLKWLQRFVLWFLFLLRNSLFALPSPQKKDPPSNLSSFCCSSILLTLIILSSITIIVGECRVPVMCYWVWCLLRLIFLFAYVVMLFACV